MAHSDLRFSGLFWLVLLVLPAAAAPVDGTETSEIRFSRDIRPILSDRCFLCHGPDRDNRKAGLRLDSFEEATRMRDGAAALVPGDPDASMLLQRIEHADPDERMPPEDSGKRALSPDQIDLVRRWIEEGGVYEDHWAFEPPATPDLPRVVDPSWGHNEIDRFVLARMEEAGLEPSPEADRATLARRLYFDLTGLPPTPEEIQAFENDPAPDAYEQLVARLLTEEPYRTRYAERMATPWLDLARYADTSGIHMDAGRTIWPYRDWVIRAYRDNLPFDDFVVHQLAGDQLPDATIDQIVASGFNRAHVTTDEGGAINEEYLLEYAVDRVNTTGEVFLGLTVGCARCHDHKFDPITSEDFYSLIAFFNSNEEPGIYSQIPDPYRALEPFIEVPDPDVEVKLVALDGRLAAMRAERDKPNQEEDEQVRAFVEELRGGDAWSWETPAVVSAASDQGTTLTVQPDQSILASGANPANDQHVITLTTDEVGHRALLIEALGDPSQYEGRVGRPANGNAIMSGVSAEVVSKTDPTQRKTIEFTWAWADVEQEDGDFRVTNTLRPDDGRVWAAAAHQVPGKRHLLYVASEPFGYEGGSDVIVRVGYTSPYAQHSLGRTRLHLGTVADTTLAQLPTATTNWYIVGPYPTSGGKEAYDTNFGPEEPGPLAFDKKYGDNSWRYAPGVREAELVTLAQGVGAEYVGREIYTPTARPLELSLGSDDGLQIFLNGKRVFERRIDRGVAADQDQTTLQLEPGLNTLVCKVVNTGGPGAIYHRAKKNEDELPDDGVLFILPESQLDEGLRARATNAWRSKYSPRFTQLTKELEQVEAERAALANEVPKTMVMRERAMPRDTYVMTRGLYDQPDMNRKVSRAVPAVLGELKVEGTPSRVDLAEWLVGDQNPLTARVTVNRFWETFFGRGLVETSNDFGMQGSWPTHPELLDYLSVHFKDNGWDVHDLVTKLVTSATYRQASVMRPDVRAADPNNELLAFYPRQRLTAEQIRDQALYVSGLLVEKLGGPSVKPYQPEGLWREVAMPQSNTRTFERSYGDGLWRRSLYTYWKRAAPPPSMLTFDAPTREYCSGTRRISTNTPLQALVLWNDEQFVEAARMVAERTLREAVTDRARLDLLYRRTTGDVLSKETAQVLRDTLNAYRARYSSAPEDAAMLVSVGEAPVPEDIPMPELASWTLLANALLSSDAAIVKD